MWLRSTIFSALDIYHSVEYLTELSILIAPANRVLLRGDITDVPLGHAGAPATLPQNGALRGVTHSPLIAELDLPAAQILQLLRDPSLLVGPLMETVTMVRGQLLCELQALFSVASALRSIHRRHHRLSRSSQLGKQGSSARVPKFGARAPSRSREQTIGCGIRWQAMVKCERLGTLS